MLFEDLVPFDLGGGVFGLRLETASPAPMAGFQLSEIPEPSSFMFWSLLSTPGFGWWWKRRKA